MRNKKGRKIPLRRILADDCIVHVGRRYSEDGQVASAGEPYPVHEGEWADIDPVLTVREHIIISDLIASTNGTTVGSRYDAICDLLAARVVAWDWTGMDGAILPQPHNNPTVFRDMSADEIWWLLKALSGETTAERKNG